MNKLRQYFLFIKRFFYYGYRGAKHTYDYDAVSGIDALTYAHISRVSDFMHDSKLTHLMWNSDVNNKDMRLLREFTELSRRRADGDSTGYYWSEHYRQITKDGSNYFDVFNEDSYKKLARIAMKKDAVIKKGLEDRYWYLLRYKVPGFWD